MFVTENQIFVVFACLGFGAACGILFSLSAGVKYFIRNKWVKIIPDIVAFAAFSVLYVLFAFTLKFPSYRVYMTAAALVGLFLYMKSFHIILAIFAGKLYNITVKNLFKYKIGRKASKGNVGDSERRTNNGRTTRRGGTNKNRFGSEI